MPWSLVGGCILKEHTSPFSWWILDLQTCCFYCDSKWSCTVPYSGNTTEQRLQEKLLVQIANNLQNNPQCYLWFTDTDGDDGKNYWQHLTSKSVPPHAEMLFKWPLQLGTDCSYMDCGQESSSGVATLAKPKTWNGLNSVFQLPCMMMTF